MNVSHLRVYCDAISQEWYTTISIYEPKNLIKISLYDWVMYNYTMIYNYKMMFLSYKKN